MTSASAFLLDLDGVFYNDTRPIPADAKRFEHLRARGIPFRFVTNTTSQSRAALARKLSGFGIPGGSARYLLPAVRGINLPARA